MSLAGYLRSAIHLFVFSSLFIAGCALVMIYQTNQLLALRYDTLHYFLFVFFSTLCSYNFHWGLTPATDTQLIRLGWTNRNKKLHYLLFVVGAIGAAAYFIYFIEHWFWVAISIVLTFLYSAPKIPLLRTLRNIAVGKTIFLAMVWMYVTTALPVFIAGEQWTGLEILFCVSRFLFIYSICILFDYRDRDFDRKEGIKSMITFLNDKGVDRLFYTSMAMFAITTCTLSVYGMSFLNVTLILIPGAVLLPLYKIARKNFSDYLYYILLDGMMMLSAILTTIFN